MARLTAPWLTLGLLAGAASRRVLEAGQSSAFHLIETLAAHLSRVILDEFPDVAALRLEWRSRALSARWRRCGPSSPLVAIGRSPDLPR